MNSDPLTGFHIAANMYGNAEIGHRPCGYRIEIGNLREAVNFALTHLCTRSALSEED